MGGGCEPHETGDATSESQDNNLRGGTEVLTSRGAGDYISDAPQKAFRHGLLALGGRRFTGIVKSYNVEKGYGFISCAESYAMYNIDVFLHKSQLGDFGVGDQVSFQVLLPPGR